MKLNLLFMLLTLFNSFIKNVSQYNNVQANIGVWLSGAS